KTMEIHISGGTIKAALSREIFKLKLNRTISTIEKAPMEEISSFVRSSLTISFHKIVFILFMLYMKIEYS
ncbi:MAG: hypothetical protein ACR2NW_07095, partial [Thermodesulfobacteriota bacterium]